MLATLPSHSNIHTNDYRIQQTSNATGTALPTIPRRVPSTPSLRSSPSTSPETSPEIAPPLVTIEGPSPDRPTDLDISASLSESDSSSSPTLEEPHAVRHGHVRRVRGTRIPKVCPPDQSTPIPSLSHKKLERVVDFPVIGGKSSADNVESTSRPAPTPLQPLIYRPGVSLRLTLEHLKGRPHSEANVHGLSLPPDVSGPAKLREFVRRRSSGQPMKSSLKSSKSSGGRGGLSVLTMGSASKSEPTTPTAKAVHFDTQLEHVKLFLAEQKPLAVSRDGSPTDDTSGTDSDFPAFIFNADPGKHLTMQVTNMPRVINQDADVALEDLVLSGDGRNVLGRIRVRNIAYAKWIAVRFTFDSWQTTSEVTAKYVESLNPQFDRFSFSIRLNDLLAKIDTRLLYLAIRYSVAGKEIWDNNGSMNYVAKFSKALPKFEVNKKDDEDSASDIADLRSQLEKVVQGRGGQSSASALRNGSALDSDDEGQTPVFKNRKLMAGRYDLQASLNGASNSQQQPTLHNRARTFPSFTSPPQYGTIPWPVKDTSAAVSHPHEFTPPGPSLGSPRDICDENAFRSSRNVPELDEPLFPHPTAGNQDETRNHKRGYFDLNLTAGTRIKRTPPSSPPLARSPAGSPLGSIPRYHSFPPVDGGRSAVLGTGSFAVGASDVTSPRLADVDESKKMTSPMMVLTTPTPKSTLVVPAPRVAGFFLDSAVGSEQSTPSITSPSSDSSCSSSPSPSPVESFVLAPAFSHDPEKAKRMRKGKGLATVVGGEGGEGGEEGSLTNGVETEYNQFLNKFCFFTGVNGLLSVGDASSIPRTRSASDLEEIFLHQLPPRVPPSSPSSRGSPSSPQSRGLFITPPRCVSLDDISGTRSGSATPTPAHNR